MQFSENLTELRRRRGLSQEQLADFLGVTRQSVSKWESGSVMQEMGKLIALSDEVARKAGIPLQHGCYIGVTGPTFETQKEYSFYRTAGADTVGMSTTPEVIAARHMGLPVFAVSIITNMGLAGLKSTHEEVQAEGAKAEVRMTKLFTGLLEEL